MARTRDQALLVHPHLEKYIADKVASGRYQSASEVVREAIRLMEERERDRVQAMTEVRQKVAGGLTQARRGELLDGETVLSELERRIASRARPTRGRAG